ncbi:transposase [Ensifer sp. KUDG1]|uniref:transposase n=1 Tax=Ensifer sp. KUDG1 TaxID=3373919 RepID=UPI003D1E2B9D
MRRFWRRIGSKALRPPSSLDKFTSDFADDYACADCLARKRWRNGFNCPKCTGNRAWRLPNGSKITGSRRKSSEVAMRPLDLRNAEVAREGHYPPG